VTTRVGQAAGVGTTSWQVDVNLGEDRTYYWRARAADPTNTVGAWTPAASFFVSAR
jgi:ribosomal protein S16